MGSKILQGSWLIFKGTQLDIAHSVYVEPVGIRNEKSILALALPSFTCIYHHSMRTQWSLLSASYPLPKLNTDQSTYAFCRLKHNPAKLF